MTEPRNDEFEALLGLLQHERGFDFRGYKRPSLMRRVLRRMQLVDIETFAGYGDYLQAHQDEFTQLFNTVLINVTSFFRDPSAWDYLAKEVLPALLRAKAPDSPVRVWSAGCASGQEPYTLAMLLAEAMGTEAFCERAKIYATDVDEEALAQARLAIYSAKAMEPIPPPLRERYFQPVDNRFQLRGELRRPVIFGRHDLVQDAPISRLDLLVCRNTLMYFNAEAQARILAKFHFALNGDGLGTGYLFLGRAEMLLTHSGLFTPLDLKYRVFAKVPGALGAPGVPGPRRAPKPNARRPKQEAGNREMAMPNEKLRTLALEESPVARIVIDANGVLALANQRARVTFSLNPKDIGRPLSDLEISYRPVELRSLIEQAYAERRAVTQTSVERRFPAGDTQFLDVIVAPLFDEVQNAIGVSITFMDVTRYTRLQEELRSSREEIQSFNEELQSSNEELETTNEELQSSNEELETTNEELQSTNEELETMNEELQSTNEELQALNQELRQRTEELNRANAYLESVLGGMRGAAIVVNRDIDVQVWNERAAELWGLREPEVRGRSLLSLDIGLPVAELRNVIHACLHDGANHSEIELQAVNRRGKTIRCHVTCTPLVTADKKREGAILVVDEVPAQA